MEEHVQKFKDLLRYVDYIRGEKVKIESFISELPHNHKGKFKFYNPQTLKETIIMATHCYEKIKEKT